MIDYLIFMFCYWPTVSCYLWITLDSCHSILFTVKNWISQNHVQWLGIPEYVASGYHMYNDNKYRFMIMQRFGTDFQKLFVENGNSFSMETTLLLALRIVSL